MLCQTLKRRRITTSICSSAMSIVRTEVKPLPGVSKGGVGIIALSDAAKLNALTVDMGKQFTQAVEVMKQKARDQEIRACIITGDGEAFSAGGDLAWLRQRYDSPGYLNSAIMVDFYNSFLCVRHIGVPTIAAINGSAIGAGLCMTLACDVRIAVASAKLGFTFPKLGIHPGMGASLLLPRIINPGIATHLLLSGDLIKGSDAVDMDLVLDAVPSKDTLLDRAMELAAVYAKNSPVAVQTTVKTLREQKFAGIDRGLMREADAQAVCYATQDYLRGLEAVKNKTTADFQGW